MQRWLRLLVVWCLALALPVQGIAGVSRAHCGQGQERIGAAQAASHHPASHHPHSGHEAAAAHRHDAAMADAADPVQPVASMDQVDEAMADQAQTQPGEWSDPGPSKCSSCASCCAGSALPSTMPRVPEPVVAPVVFAEAVVTVDAFASDGPDRPPRTHLA